jgi:hypothetical protein
MGRYLELAARAQDRALVAEGDARSARKGSFNALTPGEGLNLAAIARLKQRVALMHFDAAQDFEWLAHAAGETASTSPPAAA